MNITLTHLLAVVKGMGVEEGPNEEPAHPFYGKGKVGVLENGVVPRSIEISSKGFQFLPSIVELFSKDLLG
jgi:hypothetical protein